MFHEHREVISKMKEENKHFLKLFEKHNTLDDEITQMEKEFCDQFEIERIKKEKLKLKDDIYQMILEYKKKNNL